MIVVGPLVRRQLAASRLSEGWDTPCLSRICRVRPYPLAGSQNPRVLLEDASGPEGEGIMDAASMANGVVHNEERIGKGNELENRSDHNSIDGKTYLAVQ